MRTPTPKETAAIFLRFWLTEMNIDVTEVQQFLQDNQCRGYSDKELADAVRHFHKMKERSLKPVQKYLNTRVLGITLKEEVEILEEPKEKPPEDLFNGLY